MSVALKTLNSMTFPFVTYLHSVLLIIWRNCWTINTPNVETMVKTSLHWSTKVIMPAEHIFGCHLVLFVFLYRIVKELSVDNRLWYVNAINNISAQRTVKLLHPSRKQYSLFYLLFSCHLRSVSVSGILVKACG